MVYGAGLDSTCASLTWTQLIGVLRGFEVRGTVDVATQ